MSKATGKILTGARHWQTFFMTDKQGGDEVEDYYLLNLKKKLNKNKLVLFIINYSLF